MTVEQAKFYDGIKVLSWNGEGTGYSFTGKLANKLSN